MSLRHYCSTPSVCTFRVQPSLVREGFFLGCELAARFNFRLTTTFFAPVPNSGVASGLGLCYCKNFSIWCFRIFWRVLELDSFGRCFDPVAARIVLWIVMWCVLKFLVVCANSCGFEAKPYNWFSEFRSN